MRTLIAILLFIFFSILMLPCFLTVLVYVILRTIVETLVEWETDVVWGNINKHLPTDVIWENINKHLS
ncbi:hypothetical protein M0R19_05600 [Candidatus Pacearchaeota archaeon]|nr:hypothetical protein [Candidatus Pacearchaeota archaeon]